MTLSFFAPGIPRPQGSKRIVRGRMIESARGHAEWRRTVAMTALAARQKRGGQWPMTGAVRVDAGFLVPQKATAKPDIDKLVRAVLDALTDAGIIADDARVVQIFAVKRMADTTEQCGAEVAVWEIE